MPHHRLRPTARSQEGFTLIELLVVVLIIGILAAVAIPTFLAQPQKAADANAISTLTTIRTAESSYATGNSAFNYTTSLTALQAIEPALTQADTTYSVTFPASSNANLAAGYTVTATSPKTGTVFSLAYNATTGAVTRSCNQSGVGDCPTNQIWGS